MQESKINIANTGNNLPALDIKFKLIREESKAPFRKFPNDAGFDLSADTFEYDQVKKTVTYKTGIAISIPSGYYGLIAARSSARKKKLGVFKNSVGVIDSGYTGEIEVTFDATNLTTEDINDTENGVYAVGDRICQIIILPIPKVTYTQVDNLVKTERGEGGFGHTGR